MSDAAVPYQGLYINLDRSPERRASMERQLHAYGFEDSYRRFPGIDGRSLNIAKSPLHPGQVGAFHSHTMALQAALGFGTAAHILEDDALLSEHMRPVLEDAVATRLFDRFDIVFTDMFVNCHLGLLKSLKAIFDGVETPPKRALRLADLQIMDLAGQNFSCLTSYAVGRNAIGRLHALCRQELEAGPRVPVDIFIRDCVNSGRLRAACIAPFVTSFQLDEIAKSTIGAADAAVSPSVMVLAALRYSFFVNRDLAQVKDALDAATRTGRSADPHLALIGQALEFVVSDDFREF